MLVGDIDGIGSPAIPTHLVFREASVPIFHRIQQPLLIDEREECYALPEHLLPIHVNLKASRVKIDDG